MVHDFSAGEAVGNGGDQSQDCGKRQPGVQGGLFKKTLFLGLFKGRADT